MPEFIGYMAESQIQFIGGPIDGHRHYLPSSPPEVWIDKGKNQWTSSAIYIMAKPGRAKYTLRYGQYRFEFIEPEVKHA